MAEEKTVTGTEIVLPIVAATPEDPPAQATTTTEEDRHTRNQRHVNLIWEFTQAFVAVSVVITVLYISARIALTALAPEATEKQSGLATTAFVLLSSLASLVIGFYFGRTNHQNVGGVQLGR